MAEYGESSFAAQNIRDLLPGNRADVYNFVGNTENPERLVHLFASLYSEENTNICTPYEVVVGRAL